MTSWGRLIHLVVVVGIALGLVFGSPDVLAAPGDMTPFAGSPGTGPATEFRMGGILAVHGATLYVVHPGEPYDVIWAVDLVTGVATVVAGTGVFGTGGDGGPAAQAQLQHVGGITIDTTGQVYFTESGDEGENGRVRRIDTAGVVTTVAGGIGPAGFSGDGGPATEARFDGPLAVAVAADGTLYVGDSRNGRVRRVGTDGIISTIAGTGLVWEPRPGDSPCGGALSCPAAGAPLRYIRDIAVDPAGDLIVTERAPYMTGLERSTYVVRIDGAGTMHLVAGGGFSRPDDPLWRGECERDGRDGAPALGALLPQMWSVRPDRSGNLYIVANSHDEYGSTGMPTTCLWRVDPGGTLHHVRDAGVMLTPVFGADNTMYLYEMGQVHAYPPGGGDVVVAGLPWDSAAAVGDGGSATAAQVQGATIAADGLGNVYLGESWGWPMGARVRRVDPAGVITTFAGTGEVGDSGDGGPALSATFRSISSLAVGPDGSLYVADISSNRVRRIDPTGTVHAFAGSGAQGSGGDGGPATSADLNGASQVAADGLGNVYIKSGASNTPIRHVDPAGTIHTLSLQTTAVGPIAADGAGQLYVWNHAGNEGGSLWVREPDGSERRILGPTTLAVGGMSADIAGNVYLWVVSGDARDNLVYAVDPWGTLSLIAGGGIGGGWAYSGPATGARLVAATNGTNEIGLWADGAGRLYVGEDAWVHRIELGNGAVTASAVTQQPVILTSPYGSTVDSLTSATPPPQVPVPDGAVLPYGIVDFSVSGVTPGSRISVPLTLPGPATRYYKLDPGGYEPFDWDGTTGAQISGNVVTLTIEDGGRGDGDGIVNGVVVDPGAPAAPADNLPPDISCTPAPSTWLAVNWAAQCTASDPSGLADPATASFVLTTDVAPGTETASATTDQREVCDTVGNCTDVGPLGPVGIDRRIPSFQCDAAPSGWRNTNWTAACQANDGGAGLADPAGAVFELATGVSAGSQTAAAMTGARGVCDAVTNCATAGPLGPVAVDRTLPSVDVVVPAADATYVEGAAITAAYSCSDTGSGTASCAGTTPSGSPIDTTVGSHTFTVTANDSAGNVTTTSVSYQVVPVTSADTVSVAVGGGMSYENNGPLASGNVSVVRNRDATLNAVTGTGTLPGVSGGAATVVFGVRQFWILPIFSGNVTVNDPGAGISLSTPLLFTRVGQPTPNSAKGMQSWVNFTRWPWTPYVLTWTVTDNT